MEAKLLEVKRIRTDGGTQPRAELHEDIIAEYAEAWQAEAAFPPVTVFYDGKTHWLADGFHRVESAKRAGVQAVQADVKQGTQRDAVLFSVGANAAHGFRRTNEDKRRAVETLLRDEEWGKWSARQIAKQCAVSVDFAARMKKGHDPSLSSNDSEPRTYTTKHGTKATMNTTNIGRSSPRAKADEFLNGEPSGDLPESSDESSDDLPESPEPDPEPMTPVRGPGERVKKIALELPLNDPSAIVRTLMSFFSPDCLRRVVKELSKALEGA